MKKVVALVLAAVLACGMLAGCGPAQSPSSSVSSASLDASSSSYPENTPDFLIEYYEGYQKLAQENNFTFELLPGGPRPSETSSECFCIYFNAKGELEEDDRWISLNSNMWFYGNENGVKKSFSLNFETSDEISYIKDFITATFMYFGRLDFSTASQKMQEFINTYTGDDFSDIVQLGDYYFFIVPYTTYSPFGAEFKGIPSSELWSDYSASSVYAPIDYSLYSSPVMNKGEKVLVHGTIENCRREEFDDISTPYRISLNADDGHVYNIVYRFQSTPIVFEPGQEITVYGRIAMTMDKDPAIAAELIE